MTQFGEHLAAAAAGVHEDDPAYDASASTIVDAALRQLELFGLGRMTMDDVARRAKLSRITLYRRFPRKDVLIDAVLLRELHRFLGDLDARIDVLEDPEDKLVEGFLFTLHAVRTHTLLQRMLESEPELLLPHLTIQGSSFIGAARDFLAARVAQDVDDNRTGAELLVVSELVVRLILSFLLTPTASVDLDDPETARAFARQYIGPLLNGSDHVGDGRR